LSACADTKLLLGYHYGEWTFGAPLLESAVAHCSLAQGELGHARLLHGILKAHWNEDPDLLLETRPPDAFAVPRYLDQPLADWTAVVAMTVVVDAVVTRVIRALRDSTFQPMKSCAAKLLEEERYHEHHGQGWLRALAAEAGQRPRLGTALGDALAAAIEWLGPRAAPADRALVAGGVKDATDWDLGQGLARDLAATTAPLGIALAAPQPAWTGWTPDRRRTGPGGPSDEVLYHLRGTKNAMFKLA
jgi:ring-1,2-phenylacetyl-CoA epoxidase subunit PaaC